MNNIYKRWEQERGELNHKWLGTNYLLQLKSFNKYIEEVKKIDSMENRKELLSIFTYIILQWQENRELILDLLKLAEIELSPVNYFNYLPLSSTSESNKVWLKSIIHNTWLSKYEVIKLVENSKKIFFDADYEYNKLINLFETIDLLDDKIPGEGQKIASNFLNACTDLSYKLSEFSKIQRAL